MEKLTPSLLNLVILDMQTEQEVTTMLTFAGHGVHPFSGSQYEYWIEDKPTWIAHTSDTAFTPMYKCVMVLCNSDRR